jgi:hypothetical protein
MGFLQLSQLSLDHLPLSFADLLRAIIAAGTDCSPFGLLSAYVRVVLIVMPPQGFFEFHEVPMLSEAYLLSLFRLLFGHLQLFLKSFKFFLKFRNGHLDVLILIEMQFLFLLLFDVFDIFEFLL